MAYRVNEIFYSLQGEGYYTGTPAVFLRLSGCNLHCPFCDTDHSASTPMEIDTLVNTLLSYPSRHLVITGGEPSLQVDRLLIEVLHDAGFYVQIETNGTHPLPDNIDWVVYTGADPDEVASQFNAMHYFLQPCSGANIPETVAYILAHPHWRLSLQTHKLIDIQ